MIKKFLIVIIGLLLLAQPALAGKLTIDSTDKGQFTDLKFTSATSTSGVSGNEATIDLSHILQISLTGATPALEVSQNDRDAHALGIYCDEGADANAGEAYCVSCYTGTSGSKVAAIKVKANDRTLYLRLYDAPN